MDRLKNLIAFTNLVVGVPTSLPHGIAWGARGIKPDVATILDGSTPYTAIADTVNLTITRLAGAPANCTVLVESWHSIERSFGVRGQQRISASLLVIQGGAGSGSPLVNVQDEGVPLAGNPMTTIDFIGAGVTAVDAGGGVAAVTIPGGGGGSSGPSTVATYTQDFINTAGYTAVATGTGRAHLTANGNMVGALLLQLNAINDTATVQLNSTGGDGAQILKVGLGKLTLEWLFDDDLAVSAVNDYSLRVGCQNGLPPWPNNNTGLSFQAGWTANGNANWWAVLDNTHKFDTGIAVDDSGVAHRFTIVHDPSIPSVVWSIDGVVVHTFNGVPSINGQEATIGMDTNAVAAAGDPDINIDYIYFNYAITRP